MPKTSSARRNGAERARSPEAKLELRRRILAEAIHLFAEVGYSGFTMRKLASRIGYTPPTIYSYFKGKDELLFDVISDGWLSFQTYLEGDEGDPVKRLKRIGRRYLDFAFENPELYQLMFMHRPEFLFDLRPEKMNPRMEGLREIERGLETLREQGRQFHAADSGQLAVLFWAAVHGLASIALTVPLFDAQWARDHFEVLASVLEASQQQ